MPPALNLLYGHVFLEKSCVSEYLVTRRLEICKDCRSVASKNVIKIFVKCSHTVEAREEAVATLSETSHGRAKMGREHGGRAESLGVGREVKHIRVHDAHSQQTVIKRKSINRKRATAVSPEM